MEILRVENLNKTYGKGENQVKAVDNVSFSVQKGEFVAIIGASGSGVKSLVIGIPIGLVLSYGMYNVFRNSMEIEYVLPYKSIAVAVIFVAVVIGIIMRYSMSKINKQNIIEIIRNDNI